MSRSDEKPKILVVIPARGGSKGIPRKNIKELCGKPLIAYSIETALKSKWINRVIVSTEDAKIAEISQSYGAEVPFLRPADMAQDHSNIQDAFQFTLKRLQADGYCPDILVMLFPTHPFRTPALVDFLIGKLLAGYNPVNTVKTVGHSNLSIFVKHEDQKLFPLLQFERQNRPISPKPFYRESGLFLGTNRRGQNKPYIYLIKNPVCQIDIDSFSDFLLAEEVIKAGLFDFNLDEEGEKDGLLNINNVFAFNAEPLPAARKFSPAIADSRHGFNKSDQNVILIPIFLENNESLWLGQEGRSLIAKFLHTVMNSDEKQNVLVLTNNESLSSLAKSEGMEVYLIHAVHDPDNSDFLPLGTSHSLKYLTENKKLDAANICILNFRNPCITNGLIDQAFNQFETSKASVMLSLKKSIDHPCQLNTYYRILDAGFIHFFDDDDVLNPYLQFINRRYPFLNFTMPQRRPASGNLFYKLTKPFFLDWASRGIPEDHCSKIYFRKYSNQTIHYIPIEETLHDPALDTASSLWIHEGPHQARVIMKIGRRIEITPDPLNPAEASLAGLDINFSFPVLKLGQNDYYFTAPDTKHPSRPRCLLRLLPLFNMTVRERNPLEIEVKDLSAPVPFQLETGDICGLAYCLMWVAEDDMYDLREPFSASKKLWSGSVEKINIKTGRVIMGRQDFPEVFEPDGTFMLIRKEFIHEYIAEILNGQAKGFLMPETRSLQIKSDFDLVSYRARLREMTS